MMGNWIVVSTTFPMNSNVQTILVRPLTVSSAHPTISASRGAPTVMEKLTAKMARMSLTVNVT